MRENIFSLIMILNLKVLNNLLKHVSKRLKAILVKLAWKSKLKYFFWFHPHSRGVLMINLKRVCLRGLMSSEKSFIYFNNKNCVIAYKPKLTMNETNINGLIKFLIY